LFETNRLSEGIASLDKALEIRSDLVEAISFRIYALDFASDASVEDQQEARRLWWQTFGSQVAEQAKGRHNNSRDTERRLRIGYVSADFRAHSAALCFRPILLNHDKTQFEITCYYSSKQEDGYTKEFKGAADRWCDASQLSRPEFAERVVSDQIDILVDLSGHSAGNRLAVFACKPAPIQVTAWGHGTGTGLPTMDYMFSDPVTCPHNVRHLFAEKIVDLPCAITIEPIPALVQLSDPPVLSNGYVTFGAFNRVTKMTDEVVALWARILHAVPQSRIMLKHHAFVSPVTQSEMLEKFTSHGIAADRVIIRGLTARAEHLATFKDVDISLDPFPHNGGISTFESLQLGVPAVAMLGKAPASRVAGAILSAVGLPDWIAQDADGYLECAVKFAAMPDLLKTLRHQIPATLSSSPIGNNVLYTRAVEAAYRKMWVDYCRSAPAQPASEAEKSAGDQQGEGG